MQDGSTPAHLAAWKGHCSILSYLLEGGASPAARTVDGATPLHEAAKAGQEECCRILLQHGADTAALDADSRTPADVAIVQDFVRVAELIRPQPGALSAQHRQQQVPPILGWYEALACIDCQRMLDIGLQFQS